MSIEKAAEAMERLDSIVHESSKGNRHYFRNMARAALPHLMEEPTEDEVEAVYQTELDSLWGALNRLDEQLSELASHVGHPSEAAPPEPPPNVPEPIREMIALRPHALLPDNVIDAYNENIVEAFHRGQKSVTPAVPPEPDPRREAIGLDDVIESFIAYMRVGGPQLSEVEAKLASYRKSLSALDSLKEGKDAR